MGHLPPHTRTWECMCGLADHSYPRHLQDGGHVSYQLPTPSLGEDPPIERQTELCLLIWLLSTALPMVYMGHRGHRGHESKGKGKVSLDTAVVAMVTSVHQVGSPVGGEWTCLYSSDRHGLSMNRFQHHCSDYKHPSLLTLTCYQPQDHTLYQFAIALDTEWRCVCVCVCVHTSVCTVNTAH